MERKIQEEGIALPGNVLKVDSFLNHQIDPELSLAMGREFARLFRDAGIDRVLTVEASGIAIGVMAALELGVPLVLFPPVVTGSVITIIGLSLLPVAVNWITGANPQAADYCSPSNIALSLAVLAIILFIYRTCRGFWGHISVLLGLVIGTGIAFDSTGGRVQHLSLYGFCPEYRSYQYDGHSQPLYCGNKRCIADGSWTLPQTGSCCCLYPDHGTWWCWSCYVWYGGIEWYLSLQ